MSFFSKQIPDLAAVHDIVCLPVGDGMQTGGVIRPSYVLQVADGHHALPADQYDEAKSSVRGLHGMHNEDLSQY
jgi:hypothetical protein